MAGNHAPQIYLATPLLVGGNEFEPILGGLLDVYPIACVRFRTGSSNEAEICATAEKLRTVCHARDVPILIDTHFRLVGQLGLDGVHLPNAAKSVRNARKSVGVGKVVGTYCGSSQHAGMTAAEMGCDYVEFGPAGVPGLLGDGKRAEPELFRWWHETIEVPVVAEGGVTPETVDQLREYVDFLCLGEELWAHRDGPEQALKLILSGLQ